MALVDPEKHERASRLFLHARELEPANRLAFLEEKCGPDRELLREVEALLLHDRDVSQMFEIPARSGVPTTSVDPSDDTTHALPRPGPNGETNQPFDSIEGYRVIREIGAGGMGTVFEAHEKKLDRRVAIKVLSPQLTVIDIGLKRFRREAWIAGRLNHPNIVKVFDCDVSNDLHYFTMELVEGGSLSDVLEPLKRYGACDKWGLKYPSRLYVAWAIERVREAADALAHAHDNGVVHRDIKPRNLLLSREGSVRLADFGVALSFDASRLTTSAGRMLGTIPYMAPEQLRGRNDLIDHRTDIYALGVTLFQLLTLELPYRGKSAEAYMRAALTDAARRPRKLNDLVGRDLEVVISKAIEKDPADRYASMREFSSDLGNVLGYRPIRAVPPSAPARVWKWIRRKPLHAALVATLVIGIPVVGVLGANAIDRARMVRQLKVELLWSEARLSDREGRLDRVAELATEVLALDPNHVPARRGRGVSYWLQALEEPNPIKARKLQERSLADLSKLTDSQPDETWPRRLMGFAQRDFGREMEGQRLLEAHPFDLETASDDDLFFEAQHSLDAADYVRALHLLDVLCARRSNWPDAFELRADVYRELGRADAAVNDLRVAVALKPAAYSYHYELGILLTEEGQLVEGAEHLHLALDKKPDLAPAQSALAHNLIRQANDSLQAGALASRTLDLFADAEAAARRALEIDPDLPWAHINLGQSLIEQSRLIAPPRPTLLEEALSHYSFVISLREERPTLVDDIQYGFALNNLCDGLIESRSLDRALRTCRQVVEINPHDPDAYYNLAGVHALLGQSAKALENLERDFELGDDNWLYLTNDKWFEALRTDPRFIDLLNRMRDSGGTTTDGEKEGV